MWQQSRFPEEYKATLSGGCFPCWASPSQTRVEKRRLCVNFGLFFWITLITWQQSCLWIDLKFRNHYDFYLLRNYLSWTQRGSLLVLIIMLFFWFPFPLRNPEVSELLDLTQAIQCECDSQIPIARQYFSWWINFMELSKFTILVIFWSVVMWF